MATWICPFCEARMTVKPQLIGETRACAKCEQPSKITDADAEPEAAEPPDLPFETSTPKPRKGRIIPPGPILSGSSPEADPLVSTESLTSVSLAYGLLVLTALCSGMCMVIGMTSGGDAPGLAFVWGIFGLASVVIAWPIYTIANETFRSRRLLEQILKRQK